MITALLDRIRSFGSGARGDDIVRQSCLDPAGQAAAPRGRPIALSYFLKVKNIGDRINPIAAQYATGRPTFWTPRVVGPSLLGIGSILHTASALSHVWGTGLMNPESGFGDVRGERIWALRGKLTHANLAHEVTGLRDVPLGDPGYLVGRRVAALAPARAPTHRLGIVPHFIDRDHPGIAHLRGQDGVTILDARDPEPQFFAQMMACEAIASSSLHGLIFAEGLGIPNAWLDFGPERPEVEFKYHDWYSLAQKPQPAPLRIGEKPEAGDLIAASALHDMAIDESALRRAVPSAVLDELSVSRGKAARLVHVLGCRQRPLPIFLMCSNQGKRLHSMAAGYRKQSIATELVLIDTGNIDEETRNAVDQLHQDGALARGIDPDTPDQQAISLRRVIRLYFKDWGEPTRHAIASGAIDFSAASPDSFALYDELLDRFPKIEGVGPMLRIQDLLRDHPAVVDREITAHWSQEPSWCETSLGRIAIVQSSLAGNFALCRADGPYRAPDFGLRVHYPFDARDLDWVASPTGGTLEHDFYYDVERGPNDELAMVTRALLPSRRLNW
jgi:pyruvyltransferase